MKSELSVSIIEERVIRAMDAMKLVARAMTGMIRYGHWPPCQPPPGSQPSHRVKTSTRIGAMMKLGSTCAPTDTPTARLSSQVLR